MINMRQIFLFIATFILAYLWIYLLNNESIEESLRVIAGSGISFTFAIAVKTIFLVFMPSGKNEDLEYENDKIEKILKKKDINQTQSQPQKDIQPISNESELIEKGIEPIDKEVESVNNDDISKIVNIRVVLPSGSNKLLEIDVPLYDGVHREKVRAKKVKTDYSYARRNYLLKNPYSIKELRDYPFREIKGFRGAIAKTQIDIITSEGKKDSITFMGKPTQFEPLGQVLSAGHARRIRRVRRNLGIIQGDIEA